MFSRGFAIAGLRIPGGAAIAKGSGADIDAAVGRMLNGVQEVVSKVTPYEYEPIVVQAGTPVRWYLEAGTGDITGCNNAIISRDFGIQQRLGTGKTLVEFTPEKPGTYSFSCWMGMIRSVIMVVEDLTDFDPAALTGSQAPENNQLRIRVPDLNADRVSYSVISETAQEAATVIRSDSLDPVILITKANMKTKWSISTGTGIAGNVKLVFPAYRQEISITPGDPYVISFEPQQDFFYYSSDGAFLGFVLVSENPAAFSQENAIDRVKAMLERN